ncbi:hypothetical protein D3C72_1242070 [compost metagenome]
MVLTPHRHVRRGKQRGVVLLIDQQVKGVDAQFRIAGHVRQIVVHLADHQDGFSGGAAPGDHRQQVEGDVRVAAQAHAVGMLGVAGHQLRHQIQPGGIDVPRRMAVIAADVILLRRGTVEQAAGLHEELLDVDVARQTIATQVGEKFQLRIIAEDPFDKGFEKSLLQTIAQGRAPQAQRGVDRQSSLGRLCDSSIQRVDEVIGFAQPQRQAHVDMRRQPCQDVIDCLFDRAQLNHRILPHVP